jgi:hypothetical protein
MSVGQIPFTGGRSRRAILHQKRCLGRAIQQLSRRVSEKFAQSPRRLHPQSEKGIRRRIRARLSNLRQHLVQQSPRLVLTIQRNQQPGPVKGHRYVSRRCPRHLRRRSKERGSSIVFRRCLGNRRRQPRKRLARRPHLERMLMGIFRGRLEGQQPIYKWRSIPQIHCLLVCLGAIDISVGGSINVVVAAQFGLVKPLIECKGQVAQVLVEIGIGLWPSERRRQFLHPLRRLGPQPDEVQLSLDRVMHLRLRGFAQQRFQPLLRFGHQCRVKRRKLAVGRPWLREESLPNHGARRQIAAIDSPRRCRIFGDRFELPLRFAPSQGVEVRRCNLVIPISPQQRRARSAHRYRHRRSLAGAI